MVTLHEVITFLVSMQISISSLQTHNVNRCGRSRHLARKLSLRRKRSSPNVFEMAATETITSIILIKLIRVSLGTVRHPRRFKIVVIDIQITLKQMLRDFRSEERFSRNAETDLVCRLLLEKKTAARASGHRRARSEPWATATRTAPRLAPRSSRTTRPPPSTSSTRPQTTRRPPTSRSTSRAGGLGRRRAGRGRGGWGARRRRAGAGWRGQGQSCPQARRGAADSAVASSTSTASAWPPCFFFKETATPEICTLSLHDALPI